MLATESGSTVPPNFTAQYFEVSHLAQSLLVAA